jgi:hypothetical protein
MSMTLAVIGLTASLFTSQAAAAEQQVSFDPVTVTAGPIEVALPYADVDRDASRASRRDADVVLDRYQRHAAHAVVGRVLTSRTAHDGSGTYTVVTVLVDETLRTRGRRTPRLLEFKMERPLGSAAPGEVRPEIVAGYDVLAFVDKAGWLMDGDALFTVEGGHAFRKRRASVFSRPSSDRDWLELTDPSVDWTTLDLDRVADAMGRRPGKWTL